MVNITDKVLAEAVRVELDDLTGKLYIVFEVIDPELKKEVKTKWIDDSLEFKLINKKLYK